MRTLQQDLAVRDGNHSTGLDRLRLDKTRELEGGRLEGGRMSISLQLTMQVAANTIHAHAVLAQSGRVDGSPKRHVLGIAWLATTGCITKWQL